MKIEDLHKEMENQRLEFKTAFGKETIETIAAFSNASGGTVFIGVDKNGIVKGIPVNEEVLKEWVNSIKQATHPQIFPDLNILESEGRKVVSIRVQEYPIKPVSCKGKYFKRVGASNHLIPTEEILEMQLYSINSSFDSFPVEQTLKDLDWKLVKSFFSQLGNAGRITLNDDPLVNLKKTGLIRKDQLTFAALLLFGEHNTGIRIGRFKSRDVIIDDILIKSPLALAVDEAMTFIKKNISLRYDFTGELRRKETWQYPLSVIRELLLNAVIHKDYRDPTDIMIKIFDDHIQFTNPGALMGGLTPEDLMKGEYVAIHRNKLLAEAFYLRGDIEKFGTGFHRIQTELKESPDIQLAVDSLKEFTRSELKVLSKDTMHVTAHDTAHDTAQVTAQVKELIVHLTDEMSRAEIQLKLNITHREYFRLQYLQQALTNGVIELTIPDKPKSKLQKYRLTEKGKKLREQIIKEKSESGEK